MTEEEFNKLKEQMARLEVNRARLIAEREALQEQWIGHGGY